MIARGLDSELPDEIKVAVLMRVLHQRIEDSRSAGSVAPLMSFFHDNMRAAHRVAPFRAIACRRGCAHCCHSFVSARAPEVLFVKSAIPPRQKEAIRAAVEAAYAVTGTLGVTERAAMAMPCPMLQGNLCQVYAARPATCQTAVSGSAEICARAFLPGAAAEDIPTPDFYITMRSGYSLALAGALKRAGFPAASYEYNAALRAVFARPDAEAAWLAGEDVFAGVPIDPGSDPFDFARNRRLYEAAWAG